MLSFKTGTLALIVCGVCSMDVEIWDNKDCHGGSNLIHRLYALPMYCYKRGDFEVYIQLQGIGGMKEQAIAARANDTASESQYVAFFTTEDCNPDNVIDNAWLDNGCSSKLPNNPADWKSWSVWDMCAGIAGCSLE
ncbi:hypothetical protein FB567DRAFT_519972 [Paraphoma chrysanthemicola]|uniref:Uncharacterized protein n=1 Tax=Paraphoma chrysanthemicola TaxID=798071 RepID=A0A8K0RB53_9PLEO|nr:hypothetical protein FB567DRAFT_519972 [Paraphoma chrysanthemicola]